MMTSAQVVETSVNVITNSPSQDYTHPDDHNLPTYGYCTIQKKKQAYQNMGHGQNTDPQSMDYPNGLPKWTTPKMDNS